MNRIKHLIIRRIIIGVCVCLPSIRTLCPQIAIKRSPASSLIESIIPSTTPLTERILWSSSTTAGTTTTATTTSLLLSLWLSFFYVAFFVTDELFWLINRGLRRFFCIEYIKQNSRLRPLCRSNGHSMPSTVPKRVK